MLSNRIEQKKILEEKIAEAGKMYNIHYLAGCYGVSIEAVKLYWEKNKQYPLLYYAGDTEENIVSELNMIERLLKIKKLRNV